VPDALDDPHHGRGAGLDAELLVDPLEVAYGEGVQFLQRDPLFSDEGPKVAALAARGVVFKVCENSLRAGTLVRGDLLPRVEVVPSGTLEIARLQREGYAYIRP